MNHFWNTHDQSHQLIKWSMSQVQGHHHSLILLPNCAWKINKGLVFYSYFSLFSTVFLFPEYLPMFTKPWINPTNCCVALKWNFWKKLGWVQNWVFYPKINNLVHLPPFLCSVGNLCMRAKHEPWCTVCTLWCMLWCTHFCTIINEHFAHLLLIRV